MRNLVPLGARRWRLKMAPDPDAGEPGALETIVGCCYDPQSRVVYAVTSACNLYGVHIGGDSGGGDASRPFLRMSLLVGGGGDGALADEEPALPARSVAVGVEYIAELRGVCIAVASGELILVAPDPDDDHATTTARGGAKVGEAGVQIPAGAVGPECIPECVGAVSSGIRAMRWNPDGEILLLASGDGQLVCMNKDFFVLAEAPLCRTTATASLSWRGRRRLRRVVDPGRRRRDAPAAGMEQGGPRAALGRRGEPVVAARVRRRREGRRDWARLVVLAAARVAAAGSARRRGVGGWRRRVLRA